MRAEQGKQAQAQVQARAEAEPVTCTELVDQLASLAESESSDPPQTAVQPIPAAAKPRARRGKTKAERNERFMAVIEQDFAEPLDAAVITLNVMAPMASPASASSGNLSVDRMHNAGDTTSN